jgi:hypothetical protein
MALRMVSSCRTQAMEFRQFGDERSRRHWANAWRGGEKLFGLAPNRRGAHAGVDVGVDLGEFLFEECDVAVEARRLIIV